MRRREQEHREPAHGRFWSGSPLCPGTTSQHQVHQGRPWDSARPAPHAAHYDSRISCSTCSTLAPESIPCIIATPSFAQMVMTYICNNGRSTLSLFLLHHSSPHCSQLLTLLIAACQKTISSVNNHRTTHNEHSRQGSPSSGIPSAPPPPLCPRSTTVNHSPTPRPRRKSSPWSAANPPL